MSLFKKQPRPTVVIGGERFTEEEIDSILVGTPETSPLWRVVLQLVGDQLTEARAQVGSIELADRPGALAHTAGGCEWLEYTLVRLVNRKEQAKEQKDRA